MLDLAGQQRRADKHACEQGEELEEKRKRLQQATVDARAGVLPGESIPGRELVYRNARRRQRDGGDGDGNAGPQQRGPVLAHRDLRQLAPRHRAGRPAWLAVAAGRGRSGGHRVTAGATMAGPGSIRVPGARR